MMTALLDIRPIAGALGAEIHGVDLAQPLADDTIAAVRRALLDHLVIFFPGQSLSPARLVAFGKRFGPLEGHEFVEGMSDHPEVLELIKEADEGGFNFGGDWHTDVTFRDRPSMGTILYGKDIPPCGGDTLWANQYLAYETLSAGLQRLLGSLRAVHSAEEAFGGGGVAQLYRSQLRSMKIKTDGDVPTAVEHPVVRTHPETGRECLFINQGFTTRFADMSESESSGLLQFLFAHSVRPEFTCRFRWSPGAVAFWDNRATQHFALNDYHGHRRHMQRITVAGDRPI